MIQKDSADDYVNPWEEVPMKRKPKRTKVENVIDAARVFVKAWAAWVVTPATVPDEDTIEAANHLMGIFRIDPWADEEKKERARAAVGKAASGKLRKRGGVRYFPAKDTPKKKAKRKGGRR